LEQGTCLLMDDRIEISFQFDTGTIARVREIEGRKWNEPKHPGVWTVPVTGWHADQVVQRLPDFYIDPVIKFMASGEKLEPKIKLPKELYKFQKEGVKYIASTKGRCILADDMGLGKSAEALVFSRLFAQGRVLIVCPSNVSFKWKDEECPKWYPDATVEVIRSGKDSVPDTDIVIISYGLLQAFYDELKAIPFEVIIVDESHYCKSLKTIRTKVVKALVHGGIPRVLLLSGTPFMNHPGELFSQLHILDPVGFPSFYPFAIRYCGAHQEYGMWVFPKDVVTNRDELAKRLERYMIRRTKQQVELELPELVRSYIPMEISNMKEYMKALEEFKEARRKARTPAMVLTQLTKLRQIIGKEKVTPSVELAEDILEGGKKVVIFAIHKEVVAMLEKAMHKYGVGVISGDVQAKDRQVIIKAFLDRPQKRVMIITTAGAEGINLYSASDIIFCERDWVPAREEQAEARLHRIGQKSNVTAHYPVVMGTVDEKISNVVRLKREVVGQVIDQNEILEIILESI